MRRGHRLPAHQKKKPAHLPVLQEIEICERDRDPEARLDAQEALLLAVNLNDAGDAADLEKG